MGLYPLYPQEGDGFGKGQIRGVGSPGWVGTPQRLCPLLRGAGAGQAGRQPWEAAETGIDCSSGRARATAGLRVCVCVCMCGLQQLAKAGGQGGGRVSWWGAMCTWGGMCVPCVCTQGCVQGGHTHTNTHSLWPSRISLECLEGTELVMCVCVCTREACVQDRSSHGVSGMPKERDQKGMVALALGLASEEHQA